MNLGYVAAPTQSITDQARALARELSVGIIGVETPHNATLVEPARVTGAGDFSTAVDAIRFQATTHRLTEVNFPLVRLFLDEAHLFAPSGHSESITDPLVEWVRQGRCPGLSLVMATQQHGALDNRILS